MKILSWKILNLMLHFFFNMIFSSAFAFFRAYFYNIFAFRGKALTQSRQDAVNDGEIRNNLGFKTFGRRQPATT